MSRQSYQNQLPDEPLKPRVKLTVERVAQVDLVPERVAELDADELAVPRPLHVLLAVAIGVRVRRERELGPDGVFPCGEAEGRTSATTRQCADDTVLLANLT